MLRSEIQRMSGLRSEQRADFERADGDCDEFPSAQKSSVATRGQCKGGEYNEECSVLKRATYQACAERNSLADGGAPSSPPSPSSEYLSSLSTAYPVVVT